MAYSSSPKSSSSPDLITTSLLTTPTTVTVKDRSHWRIRTRSNACEGVSENPT